MDSYTRTRRMAFSLILVLSVIANAGAAEKTTVVRWAGYASIAQTASNPDSVVVKRLEEEIGGVDLRFVSLPKESHDTRVVEMLSSGELDVAFVDDYDTVRKLYQSGKIALLSIDEIKNRAGSLYAASRKFGGDDIWSLSSMGGKVVLVPQLDVINTYHYVPIWRDDWLKKVGIKEVPTNIDQAVEALRRFARGDPDGNGKNDTYGLSEYGVLTLMGAFLGAPPFTGYMSSGARPSIFFGNGRAFMPVLQPEMRKGLDVLNGLYKEGIIKPDFMDGETKNRASYRVVSFYQGEIGFSTGGTFYQMKPLLDKYDNKYSYIAMEFSKYNPEGSYVTGPPIVGPNGGSGMLQGQVFRGRGLVFSKALESDRVKRGLVLDILEKLAADFDFYTLAGYGTEEMFEIGPIGTMYSLFDTNQKAANALGTYGFGPNVDNNLDFSRKENPLFWGYADKVARFGDWRPVLFEKLPSEGAYMPGLQERVRSGIIDFITGKRNTDEFGSFVRNVMDSGAKRLLDEAWDWYKAYF